LNHVAQGLWGPGALHVVALPADQGHQAWPCFSIAFEQESKNAWHREAAQPATVEFSWFRLFRIIDLEQ
jgi:hypothetical protein